MNENNNTQTGFGVKNESRHQSRFLKFEEARKLVRTFQLKTQKEWTAFCRDGCRPANIPALPNRDYHEFTTWDDFLLEPDL